MSIEKESGSDLFFNVHKSIGLVIATLVVIRFSWRLSHPPVHLPPVVPRWQARLAGGVQASMYVLMVLLPVSGYLGASYSKAGVSFFGWAIPRWTVEVHDRADQLFELHETLLWTLVVLVAIHVLGAAKHLMWDRDGLFHRMWFN